MRIESTHIDDEHALRPALACIRYSMVGAGQALRLLTRRRLPQPSADDETKSLRKIKRVTGTLSGKDAGFRKKHMRGVLLEGTILVAQRRERFHKFMTSKSEWLQRGNVRVAKHPISLEIVDVPDGRIVVTEFPDGKVVRIDRPDIKTRPATIRRPYQVSRVMKRF